MAAVAKRRKVSATLEKAPEPPLMMQDEPAAQDNRQEKDDDPMAVCERELVNMRGLQMSQASRGVASREVPRIW
ncbi:hypothetical protein AB1Y20_017777 [Prymnesium parvum]